MFGRFCLPLLLLASAASAAPDAGSPVPQDRLDAAARLLTAMQYDQLMDATTGRLIAELQRALPAQMEAQSDQALPDDLKQKLAQVTADFMRQQMAANRPEMRKSTMLIYAHHFTADELDHLARLQSDPVLQKMQKELPAIAAETVAFTQAEMQRDTPRLVQQLKAVIAEYFRAKS
jgi:hypothetical protein